MPKIILAAHAFATLSMVGLIWFIQVVHYPMFALVGEDAFQNYEAVHQRLTTYVVAPLMLVELGTAATLVANRPAYIGAPWAIVGLCLVGVIWLSTWFLQVPAHNALQSGFDAAIHHRLVTTNWLRTIAWTLRGLLVVWWYSTQPQVG